MNEKREENRKKDKDIRPILGGSRSLLGGVLGRGVRGPWKSLMFERLGIWSIG
ncbi:predicted protein [Sclerotinia sclerotiorum 1980 UF-70]|uniref:Uncharacterized protein n=1 Tax=Sclerotinia sclerotiorum (strain ATCC 18683 / 1980 / Ss-1) TaxID=665079 RepID=A7E5H3_SCLS1|nr:predicted protein [Sclerotinia sclerotiorum 1980 UF-70]EDN91145.1 predicted protein [Sclerotinia sclerotiorum 1980 UF-70]